MITCFDGVVRYTDGFQVTMLDFRSDPIIPPDVVGLGLVVGRSKENNVRQLGGMRHT